MYAICHQMHHTFPRKGLNNLVKLLYPVCQLLVRSGCAVALLGRGLAREEFTVRAARGRWGWGTHISDGSLLVDLCLEILENALVDHFVGCGGFS